MLTRREVDKVVVAYSFDLRTTPIHVPNPNAGREHVFKAYRVAGDPTDPVSLRARNRVVAELGAAAPMRTTRIEDPPRGFSICGLSLKACAT